MSQASGANKKGIQQMPETVISFTTIEFPNEEMMEKTYDIFQEEMKSVADKLRPAGMIKFNSSRQQPAQFQLGMIKLLSRFRLGM